jgi:hypothetical protein
MHIVAGRGPFIGPSSTVNDPIKHNHDSPIKIMKFPGTKNSYLHLDVIRNMHW